MRRFKISAVLCVFVLVIAAPALLAGTTEVGMQGGVVAKSPAPSKICNPKKPITCRADFSLQNIADAAQTKAMAQWMTTPKANPANGTQKAQDNDLGRLCMPPRWLCVAPTI